MRFFSLLLMAIISSTVLAFGPDTRAEDAPLKAFVVGPTCPSEIPPAEQAAGGALGLVLEPILGPLISTALDEAGAYLASAAAVKSAQMSTFIERDFYSLDRQGNISTKKAWCLVLISPGTGSGKPIPPWYAKAKQRAANDLNQFSASPRFYFEAKVVADETPGVSRLNITPNFLHVGEFLEDSWSYRNVRKYSVAATFRSKLSGEVFGSFKFDFDDISRSTWGTTQEISDGEKDNSITAQLLQKASTAHVPFYPTHGDVSSAALAQQQIAAPYLEANTLLDKSLTSPPVRRLANWEIRSKIDPSIMSTEAQKYQHALEALCNSVDAINHERKTDKERLSDTRCPITYIGYLNEAEEARKALEQKLAKDWAIEFAKSHLKDLPKTCHGQDPDWACDPPNAKQPLLGPYMIELAIVETREPTQFAKALATTFAANKDKLKTAIEDRTLPSRRETAQQSAEDAAQKAKVAFELAKLDVEKATAKLLEAAGEPRSVQVELQAEVLKAKVTANTAAKAAGIASPYAF